MAVKPEGTNLNINDNTKKNLQPKVSKLGKLLVVITYIISNFVFLCTVLVHMPLIRDTMDFGALSPVVIFVAENYIYGVYAATATVLVDTVIMVSSFLKTRFPTKLSIGAMLYNDIACTLFCLLIYIVNLKNVYFSFQVLFVIPIITIFLSSVFIIDDYDEMRRGVFIIPSQKQDELRKKKKKKRKNRGELQQTSLPEDFHLQMPEIFPHSDHESAAHAAAKIAIPALGATDEKSYNMPTNLSEVPGAQALPKATLPNNKIISPETRSEINQTAVEDKPKTTEAPVTETAPSLES